MIKLIQQFIHRLVYTHPVRVSMLMWTFFDEDKKTIVGTVGIDYGRLGEEETPRFEKYPFMATKETVHLQVPGLLLDSTEQMIVSSYLRQNVKFPE